MEALNKALNDFYQACADVGIPRHIDGCPCCIDEKQLRALVSKPLRELATDDLTSYASSALLTVGDRADYLHFLPRILELSIREDWWWPDIEITARAIRSTDFSAWPANRRETLLRLFQVVIEHFVDSNAYEPIDGWLCAMALIGVDVRPHLARIETDRAAVLHYFENNVRDLRDGKLSNPFWELPNDGHDAILQWFRSETVRKIPAEEYGYVW